MATHKHQWESKGHQIHFTPPGNYKELLEVEVCKGCGLLRVPPPKTQ